jgi:pimeloyl-ACP methyl ester carboxylesterase
MRKTIILTVGILLFAASAARAQQTSGTYTMFVGSNAVSTENYVLVSEPNGAVRAKAEISIRGGKQKTTPAMEKYPQIIRMLMTQLVEAKAGKPDSATTDLREYMRQHLALNHAEIYKRIHCPVLILQGERDALVLERRSSIPSRVVT